MDPVRLLDQSDLSALEREVLEAGRDHPVAYDATAGAARLAQALATTPTAPATPAAPAVRAWLKLGLKLLVCGVIAGVVLMATRAEREPIGRSASAPSAPSSTPELPVRRAKAPEDEPAAQPEVDLGSAATAPSAPILERARKPKAARGRAGRSTPADAAPVQVAPAATLAAAPSPQDRQLVPSTAAHDGSDEVPERAAESRASATMRELRAIAQAKRALARGEPARALSILNHVASDFPTGYLVEERRALVVLALAADGQSARARGEADAFLADYPSSPFKQRVWDAVK